MGRADDIAAADFASVSVLPDERGRVVSVMEDQAGHRVNRRAVVSRQHNRFAPIGEDKAPGILWFVLRTVEALQLEPARP